MSTPKKSTNEKSKEIELQATDVLPKVADAVTEKAVNIKIDIKPKNKIHEWLIKLNIMPSKRFYEIKPQRVGNVYRIAGRAVTLNVEGILTRSDTIGTMMDIMSKHGDDIIYIVACAIQNNHREPTATMIDIVKNEFEMQDILKIMQIAVGNYNIPAFLSSTALITGIDALNVKSPNQ